jgi:hypothetical protein
MEPFATISTGKPVGNKRIHSVIMNQVFTHGIHCIHGWNAEMINYVINFFAVI